MDVPIAPDLQGFVDEKVKSGQFRSAEEVVSFALDSLRDREERLAWLREEVGRGIGQLDHGEGLPWDLENTKARLLARHKARSGN